MGLTGALCARIASTGPADLGDAARQRACQLVLDGIAAAFAGTREEEAPALLAAHWREQGGAPEASVIGFGFRTTPYAAAYVNGAAMHVLDYEPMWSPANHALSTTLPAVLALAEARGIGGAEAAAALIKGTEIQGWIRVASRAFEPKDLKFHPPGVVGAFGAAVAAGHLLGLDADRLAHALGLAGSRTGALLANVGTMTKSTHCGLAGALGLEAALLAARGFTANTGIFEDPRGYAATFGPDRFVLEDLLRFGPPFRAVTPGYAIKMFPSQYGTHFAITAALAARARIDDPGTIEAATITAPVMPYIDRPVPKTGLDGKFSFQYATACALLDGAITIESFSARRRFAADMERLLPRMTLVQSPAIPASFEAMHVKVAVQLAGGGVIEARCDKPRGIFGGPPLSSADHRRKVADCLSRGLADAAIEEIIDLARRFDSLAPQGIRRLMTLVATSAPAPARSTPHG